MSNFLRKILVLGLAVFLLSGCSVLDKKNVAGLQVITPEVESSLFLDGEYLDKAPFINKEIKPGTYSLSIKPDDDSLVNYETQVTLHKGTLTVVTWNPSDRPETSGGVIYELEKTGGNKSELSFITIPDNALVSVDNGPEDFSPLSLDNLEPGLHQFKISLTAYQTQQHNIHLPAGYLVTVTAKLARGDDSQKEENIVVEAADFEEPEASLSGTVTIVSTNFYQDGVEVLRVRSASSSAASTLGFAEVGENYEYLGINAGGWVQILFDEKPGWVSSQFADVNE